VPPNESPYALAVSKLSLGKTTPPPPAGPTSGVVHVFKLP
jgi:hypothetical protein